MPVRVALLAALLAALAPEAHADPDYFGKASTSSQVVVRHEGSRTTKQRALIWGLFGAAAVSGGIGVYFHVDSHSAATSVSTTHDRIVGTWTADEQATFDRAGSSGTKAIVGYALAGAFAAGALVTAILTRPGYQNTALSPTASVTAGGAMLGVMGHL